MSLLPDSNSWSSSGGEEGMVGGMTIGLPRLEMPLLRESARTRQHVKRRVFIKVSM